MDEFKALGPGALPVTVVGDVIVVGFNRRELERAFSLGHGVRTSMGAATLLAGYERILGAFLRANRQVPDEKLAWKSPERDRTLRGFIYHVYDRPNLVLDGVRTGVYRYEDIQAAYTTAEELETAEAVARYGEGVLKRLREFLGNATEEELDRSIDSYQGVASVRDLLDLALGHAAHHLRQLYHYFERLGITPEAPLGGDDFAGIPLPSRLF